MKRLLLLFLLINSSLGFSQTWRELVEVGAPLDQVKAAFESDLAANPEMGGKNHFYRWYEFMLPRCYPSQDWTTIKAQYGQFESEISQAPANRNGDWENLGPDHWENSAYAPGNGRVNFVAVHPANTALIYAGTPAGGIWKSENGGSTWTPLSDGALFGGVSAIALHPNDVNTLYIGTGDMDASDTEGLGVYKSNDGGQTWVTTGLTFNAGDDTRIARVLIHPENPEILLAAGSSGVYRSENGGLSWVQVRNGSFRDMAFKPGDPNVLYAARSDILFRSLDNGVNWSSVTSGLPSPGDVGRIAMAVSPANPEYVYLVIANDTSYGLLGVYRSTNSGDSFSLRTDSPNILDGSEDGETTGGQAWFDLAIVANPTDEDEILVGGINLWHSTDGGSSFDLHAYWVLGGNNYDYVHADIHHLTSGGNNVYCGSDGGVFRSNWSNLNFTDISEGLSISQCYRIAVDPGNPDRVMVGLQDNGTVILNNGIWTHIQGGDGMVCHFVPSSPNTVYLSAQYGAFYSSNNGGFNTDWAANGITEDGVWTTPWIIDPNNSSVMYGGFSNVWRSNNGGDTWSQTSSTLNTELRSLAISASNSNVVYAASYSTLFRTANSGTAWNNLGSPSPGNAITEILCDPNDENHIWLSLSGFVVGNKIFESLDGGQSWNNLSIGLPNLPINCMAYDTELSVLYAGTDFGVWMLHPELAGWQPFEEGLPKTIVNDLVFHNSNQLFAGTYGRGVWRSPRFTEPEGLPTAAIDCSAKIICAGNSIAFTDLSIDHQPNWNWSFSGGTPNVSSTQNPEIVYTEPGEYDVSLTVQNDNGTSTFILENAVIVLPENGVPVGSTEEFVFEQGVWDYLPKSENRWQWNDQVGYLDNSCIYVENFNYDLEEIHEIISPSFDLNTASSSTSAEGALMTFAYAYAQMGEDDDDRFRLYFSSDCGETWTLIRQWRGTIDLPTVGSTDSYFIPANGDWEIASVEITNDQYFSGDFRYKFYFDSDNGNNMYVDRVQFSNLTTIPESVGILFSLSPQPADVECHLSFQPLNETCKLSVFDLAGKLVRQENIPNGTDRYRINTSNLDAGIYVIVLDAGKQLLTTKLTVLH